MSGDNRKFPEIKLEGTPEYEMMARRLFDLATAVQNLQVGDSFKEKETTLAHASQAMMNSTFISGTPAPQTIEQVPPALDLVPEDSAVAPNRPDNIPGMADEMRGVIDRFHDQKAA